MNYGFAKLKYSVDQKIKSREKSQYKAKIQANIVCRKKRHEDQSRHLSSTRISVKQEQKIKRRKIFKI